MDSLVTEQINLNYIGFPSEITSGFYPRLSYQTRPVI